MVGKNLSHYEILNELGRGGMGIVYKAHDTKLDRTVAIKVLPSATLASEDDRARFFREAKAAAKLHHPHIASIFEIDEAVPSDSPHDALPSPFIAMEYIDGQSLDDRIKEGPLKTFDAVEVAVQVAQALKAAHSNEIVHRDIKSANVMLTSSGSAKVLDFGLAKTAQSTKLTRMGSTLGTVSYMSPQQARVEEVDHRTDFWSLGVVLYEMLTGQLPFGAEYEQAVIYGILNEDPEPVSALRSGIPLDLERIISKCLSKDLKTRYQHADDLIADLSGVDTKALSKTSTDIAPHLRAESSGRINSSMALGFIFGLLFAGSIAALLIWNWDGRSIPRISSMSRITIEPDIEYWPSIHPDGNQVVYGAGRPDETYLYYRLIEGGPPNRLIPGMTAFQSFPSYSPDGNQVLFSSEGSIYTVESLGGSPRPVVRPRAGEELSMPKWSPTGDQIVFVSNQDSIFVYDLPSSQRVLSRFLSTPHSVAWSRDANYVAVVSVNAVHARHGTNVAPTSIWILRISDGAISQLTSDEFMDLSPEFAPDSRSLYFVSNRGGGVDIFRQALPAFGKTPEMPERLTTGLNLHSIDLSTDGSQIVGGSVRYSQNIWATPLDPETVLSAHNATAITTGDQIIEGIAISPDGTQVAYDSNARGVSTIYVMSLEDRVPTQITSGPEPDYVFDWSPYSDELSYHTFIDGSRDAYTVSISDLAESVVADGIFHDRYPVWILDANTIGFHRDTMTGRELLVAKRDERGVWGEPELLIPETRLGVQWSPVINRLLYDWDGDLFIMDPISRNVTKVEGVENVDATFPVWSQDGNIVYFHGTTESGLNGYWSVPASGGTPRQIVSMDGRRLGIGSIAADRDYLYLPLQEIESDIWVLELEE